MVDLENVFKTYKTGTHALNGVNLHIDDGEFVYIIGRTGSGKSTLIKLLDGEEVPSKGTVMVDGVNVGKLRFGRVPKYRRNIGVVFQDFRLLKYKTVFENIAFAMQVINKPNAEIRRRVREVMQIVDLSEKAKSFPDQLSGGQQQRVAIGRAIANNPKILICDEPTGNLDTAMSDEIAELLKKINATGTTVIVVTHDTNLVNSHKEGTRTILLETGSIVADVSEGGYLTDVQKD